MAISRKGFRTVWAWAASMLVASASVSASPPPAPSLDVGGATPQTVSADESATAAELSDESSAVVRWVNEHADNRGQPFLVVDKRRARLYAYSSSGRYLGDSSVLLGQSFGDESIAGIGLRKPSSLLPGERTTPAGRFATEPGHNVLGQDVVWFDYDASLAIHRLRASPVNQHREERLGSMHSEDKRISYGCIVVPVAFYDTIVQPVLGRQRGVVYVLPETRSLQAFLADDRLSPGSAASP